MAIDFGRMAKGIATGYLGAKIANTEANDALQGDIIRSAGIQYYEKTLPEHRKTEKKRASEYKQISLYLESEEAADYFDANDFILGDGDSLKRVQNFLENKSIKKDAFKDYIPTTNYGDRYNTRSTSVEERGKEIHKNLGMRQGGIGYSTIEGLVTKPMDQQETTTSEVTTAGASEQIEGTPIATSPMETKTVTSTLPRTTELSVVSDFFISKAGVSNVGSESDIAAAFSTIGTRGFSQGITFDPVTKTYSTNFAGTKNTEYNAIKSVLNDIAPQFKMDDGKTNLSAAAEAADRQLYNQTQGFTSDIVTNFNEVKDAKGTTGSTGGSFTPDFFNEFSNPQEQKVALIQHMSQLGTKSEMLFYALNFPSDVKFSDGTSVQQILIKAVS